MTATQADRLLDAALDQFVHLGLRRTTTDDIARAAGVNRVTLYRHLGDKDAIIRATLLREVQRFIAEINTFLSGLETFEDRVSFGFARTVLGIRHHPLVVRLIGLQDYEALASLTIEASEAMDLGAAFVDQMIEECVADFDVQVRGDQGTAAAVVARLIHSLALVPQAQPRLRTEDELRAFASDYLLPILSRQGEGET